MKPIIFIPGIEATNLVDSNKFGFTTVWNAYDTLGTSIKTSILGAHLDESLQEDPLYDVTPEVIIERDSIARLPYEKTIINLKNKLVEAGNNDPIYLFGYDWRMSNAENGKRLKLFTEYLKLKLLKNGGVENFQFLTHSMGGLIFCAYVKLLENYDEIGKVILAAPPFLGSPYALIHMVKGDGGFKSFLNSIFGQNEDIRKIVRTFPSIFELLPMYDSALTYTGTKKALDLIKIDAWQSNVYDDIKQLFVSRLDRLAAFRWAYLQDLSQLPTNFRQRILILAGTMDKTPTYLQVDPVKNNVKNFIRLDLIKEGMESGDGTVPEVSATCFKDSIQTIGVIKENLLEELGNNVDFHGFFLRDSRVQNIIQRYFASEPNATDNANERFLYSSKVEGIWKNFADSTEDLSKFSR